MFGGGTAISLRHGEFRESVDIDFLTCDLAGYRRLRESNAMDFDDMLRYAVLLLEQHDDVRERWPKRFRYIMVDEYQDTNHAQYRMLRALAGDHHNVLCVGDADQSIYSWRGADIRNITSFEEDFPDARTVVLDLNYRSTTHILEAANAVVRNNENRLDKELIGNVSLRVVPTDRPDAWEVQGRGELALAILVEQMRREGFELTVGKPQVVTKVIDGKIHEPMERMTIDVPEEYLGAVTQLLAQRKGRMETMSNHGTGWVRMEFLVPARGLIGFRTRFLTETRGTGIASSIAEGFEPWAGVIETRMTGSLVADRAGVATPFAMLNLQDRGTFFVEPTAEVYEGMVVGENSRNEDMDVNIAKEKKLNNIRSSTAESFENVVPPRKLTLEESLEFAREDECVEVTPEVVRIRKVVLDQTERARIWARTKKG